MCDNLENRSNQVWGYIIWIKVIFFKPLLIFSLAEPAENPEVLIFRQDYRINKIFCLSGLRPIGAYTPAGRKAKSILPLRGKWFTHCHNTTVMPEKNHPLSLPRPFFPLKQNCLFSASSPLASLELAIAGRRKPWKKSSPSCQATISLRLSGFAWNHLLSLSALAPKPIRVYPVNPVKKYFGFISFRLTCAFFSSLHRKLCTPAQKNVHDIPPQISSTNNISRFIYSTLVAI